MHILALDTSRFPGSLALLKDAQCLRQVALPAEGKTAQTLFGALAEAFAQQAWQPADIELVAVTIGPGSFTGLRIGVTFAKTWAYARGAHVLGLETPDVVAEQCEQRAERLHVVLNAERRQLFVTEFRPQEAANDTPNIRRWRREGTVQVLDRARWAETLVPGTLATGEGLADCLELLPDGVRVAPREAWPLQAATLGRLAWRAFQHGERGDPWHLLPRYYRPSAAEEKVDSR